MAVSIIFGGGITIGDGFTIGHIPSFTINSADITNPQLRYGGYSSYTSSGFTSGVTQLYNGLRYDITDSLYNIILAAQTAAGFNSGSAWVWSAAFTTGGTVLVRMGLVSDVPSYFVIAPIDQTDTRWQTGSDLGPTVAGTFTFPAVFTPYVPTTQIQGANQWC